MKQQIILIHGGSAYGTYEEFLKDLREATIDLDEISSKKSEGWKDTLAQALGADFEVLYPEMPNWANAHFLEWKIWFEKLIPFVNEQPVILVGHSLGAIFLAQYLSETIFPKKIKAVFLLAGPYRLVGAKDGIGDFVTPDNLSGMEKQSENVFIYHSKEDPVCEFDSALKYQAALPKAKLVTFEGKGHFRQPEFPELVQQIKELAK